METACDQNQTQLNSFVIFSHNFAKFLEQEVSLYIYVVCK